MKKLPFILLLVSLAAGLAAQAPRLVVPVGHTHEITSVSFSPDGKYVLTGSRDKTAKLWDRSGREIATFAWHSNTISAVAFSPDGKFILTGSDDDTAGLWEISGTRVHTLRGHGSAVKAVTFSPDGQYLLTGSDDGNAKLWDFYGKEITTFSDHPSGVLAVAFSAGGKYILTGSGKSPAKSDQTTSFGIARLFDRESGLEIRAFSGHAAPVTAVAFSADGKYVVTGSLDASAKLYELETGREVRTFKSSRGIMAVSISPDGKYLLAASKETAQCWDLQSGNPLRSWEAHPDAVISSITFSPFHPGEQAGDNYILAGGERSAELLDWTGQTICAYTGHSTAATALAFFAAAANKTLLMGCADGSSKRWNLSETGIQTLAEHDEAVVIAAFSVDGNSVLTAAADNTVKQWDQNGRVAHSFAGTLEYPPAIALSPPGPGDPVGGKYILYGTRENSVEVWSRQPRKKIQTINRPFDQGRMFEARVDWEQFVSALAFSPADGGKFILIGDSQGNIEIRERDTGGIIKSIKGSVEADVGKNYFQSNAWQTKTFEEYMEEELKKLEGHTGAINCVAYSPDGKFLLSASADRTAKLWDAQYRLLHAFSHSAPAITTAFSPACPDDPVGGKFILTGSADNTVKLWHRASGEMVHTFEGHTATTSAFSSDGKFVFTGSLDNTTKIWDIQSGQELATLISIGATDWVITTPSGLFDASPGAMNLMYFVQGLEVIELEQLKERYYEPGLLSKLMGFSSEPMRSVAAFEAIAMYPLVQLQLDSAKHQVRIALQPRNGGMGKLSIFVNDKEIIEDALQGAGPGRSRDTSIVLDLEPYARYFLTDTFNTISVRAYNRENWLRSPLHTLRYRPEFVGSKGGPGQTASPSPFRKKRNPALHLLLVGVHDYAGVTLDLKYTAKDAEDMANALQQAGTQLFGADSVFVHLLSTSPGKLQPGKANIQDAFEAIAARAKAEDILLAYFSGHGVNYGDAEKSLFYFLTMETGSFDLSDPGIRAARAISSEELTQWINKAPAQKQVLIVDACNSGKLAEDMGAGGKSLAASQIRAMDRMKDRTGMFILSGSAADQKSFEASKFRQSLLTYSLLEAMQGAALNSDRDIDVMRLFDQARTRVRELAAELTLLQEPVPNYPRNAGTIFIGRVNENVNINLAQPGAVFVGSIFLDEAQFNDPLGLADAVNNYLREQDAEGAGFLFFDFKNIPDAYSIKGLYTLSGDAVIVRARLFKGNAVVGEAFTVTGNKGDVTALVEALVEKVQGFIK